MENVKIKKSLQNRVGRPKYKENTKELKELFKQVANKEITNEQRLETSKMSQNKMV